MQVPEAPPAQKISLISPSLYEAVRACKAKALWIRFGPRDIIPETPNVVLGITFHKVMEAAALNQPRSGNDIAETVRSIFDSQAQAAFGRAHPLLRGKYPTKEHLPHYFLQRERAVAVAVRFLHPMPGTDAGVHTPEAESTNQSERTFTSSDGLITGRIDWLKAIDHGIFDYKSGMVREGEEYEVSDRERRQLLLYSYLAQENSVEVRKGTIIRSNGTVCSIDITPHEANAASQEARRMLQEYNNAVEEGKGFNEMAEPSKEACWFCPCIPACQKFWQVQKDDWAEFEGFGWHIEGTISQLSTAVLQGLVVMTFTLKNCAGTDIQEGAVVTIEQVPTSWISPDPRILPKEGDIVRIVHARKSYSESVDVFRVDKALSTIWQVLPADDHD
jgi:hypothetical protein